MRSSIPPRRLAGVKRVCQDSAARILREHSGSHARRYREHICRLVFRRHDESGRRSPKGVRTIMIERTTKATQRIAARIAGWTLLFAHGERFPGMFVRWQSDRRRGCRSHRAQHAGAQENSDARSFYGRSHRAVHRCKVEACRHVRAACRRHNCATDATAPSTNAKLRNQMCCLFNHAIRNELHVQNPINGGSTTTGNVDPPVYGRVRRG